MQTQNSDTQTMGVVYKKTLGHYTVHHQGNSILCTLSSKLWKSFEFSSDTKHERRRVSHVSEKKMDPIAVGDHVSFVPSTDGTGMIVKVHPRENYLARSSAKPMPGSYAFEQVIAANLDQIIPVFAAADPEPKWHMLDRCLVAAESYTISSHIVITKVDLVIGTPSEQELMSAVDRYCEIGYPVTLTSAVSGEGLDELRQILEGRISVLIGKSGVGKTSLLNALEPDLGLRVQAVNIATGKGRHTTTHLELFPIDENGAIIDTPGLREFGVWGLDSQDVAPYFPEMRRFLGQCKFGLSCQHDEEPGCAVRQAVMDGTISPYRYKSYLRLKADL